MLEHGPPEHIVKTQTCTGTVEIQPEIKDMNLYDLPVIIFKMLI